MFVKTWQKVKIMKESITESHFLCPFAISLPFLPGLHQYATNVFSQ